MIRAVIATCDALFDGESRTLHPRAAHAAKELVLTLSPLRNTAHDVDLRVLLGSSASSTKFLVHTHTVHLPPFCMFASATVTATPRGRAAFELPQGESEALSVLQRLFLLGDTAMLPLQLTNLRTGAPLVVAVESKSTREGDGEKVAQLAVYSDEVDTLADLTQAMGDVLGPATRAAQVSCPYEKGVEGEAQEEDRQRRRECLVLLQKVRL